MRNPPPPPRYRIFERDRRLVVVDNWADGQPERQMMIPVHRERAKTAPGKLERIAFDGRTAFTTHRFYDAKGPRTLILDPGSVTTVNGIKVALACAAAVIATLAMVSPLLLLPLLFLTNRKLRDEIRRASTAWLDKFGHHPS